MDPLQKRLACSFDLSVINTTTTTTTEPSEAAIAHKNILRVELAGVHQDTLGATSVFTRGKGRAKDAVGTGDPSKTSLLAVTALPALLIVETATLLFNIHINHHNSVGSLCFDRR